MSNDDITSSIEIRSLQELAEMLQEIDSLNKGASIPVVPRDGIADSEYKIAVSLENDTVVALIIRYAGLASLPDSLGQLSNLQVLDVTGNLLTSLPASIGNLHKLKKLYLDANLLTSLPETLGNLWHLEELHVDENRLTSLPETIEQLTNLKILNTYNNRLITIPAGLSRLAHLEE
ncbi:MAG TPA: leucine-rich repeat domain-containing protein, partial [Ktedonobacteraceae bacterium]